MGWPLTGGEYAQGSALKDARRLLQLARGDGAHAGFFRCLADKSCEKVLCLSALLTSEDVRDFISLQRRFRHKHNLVTQPTQMAFLGVTGSPEGDLMRLIPT